MRGAVFMMASMAGYISNDTLFKLLLRDLAFFQAIALRGVAASILVIFLAAHFGAVGYVPMRHDRRIIALRVLGEVGGTCCYLTALSYLPLANATAILQVLPLTVTLGAALFLGERVGWRRYTAITVGFLGVLLVVRPGFAGFDAMAIFALAAVGFLTLRDLCTRRLSEDVPSLFVTMLTAVAITILGLVLSPFTGWAPIDATHVFMLVATAVCLLVGYLCGVLTMRVGEIGFVSPFRYTILIWAITLGIVVLGEWPDALTLGGAAIIVMTGLYSFHREWLSRSPS